jgi:hypothetical protein
MSTKTTWQSGLEEIQRAVGIRLSAFGQPTFSKLRTCWPKADSPKEPMRAFRSPDDPIAR